MDYESGSATLERPEDLEKDQKGVVRRWLLEIKLADKREDKWRKQGEKVWKRYRQEEAKKHSFNILWSNTETLFPAVYNSLPKPDVRRRFKDADPVGKAVSEVLSRSLEFGLDSTGYDFDSQIKGAVLDMLLPGRGTARVRYIPTLEQVGVTPETHEEANEQHADGEEALEGDSEELTWEQAPIEHVQWDDFRILCAAKEWSEVTAIAFKHRMTRQQLEEKFPDCGSEVQLDATDDEDIKAEQDEAVRDTFKTACVWEIWDKEKSKVLFICQGYKEKPLKTLDDPLNLTGFFPIPRPIYAIEDSGSLIPKPLFDLYKEQADELDETTRRINLTIKAIKARGVYDATLSDLSELMRADDNDLIPSQNVTALLERGGLEKAIWFLPVEQLAVVLKVLYESREATKQVIYEITGISDILRGATNPNETLGAQQIKANWGGARIKKQQQEVARFIRDLLRLQAEIIGERFQPETLATMTGLQFPTEAEKQQAMMQWQAQAQMAQQQGQQPPPQPQIGPTWEEIIGILRDDKLRTFKVDVESDSTIAASIESDMAGLKDVLGGIVEVGNGMGELVQAGVMPVEAMKEVLLAVVRRSKLGNAVEDAIDKIQQPPPKQEEQDNSAQVEQIRQQANMQIEQVRQQGQMQLETMRQQHAMQLEQMRMAQEQQAEQMRMQMEAAQAKQDATLQLILARMKEQTAVEVAQISAQTTLESAQISAANQASKDTE